MELKFIGDRSGILGTIVTPWGKLWAKMTKFEFPPAEPMARKRSTGQKTVRMTRQSVKRVIPQNN